MPAPSWSDVLVNLVENVNRESTNAFEVVKETGEKLTPISSVTDDHLYFVLLVQNAGKLLLRTKERYEYDAHVTGNVKRTVDAQLLQWRSNLRRHISALAIPRDIQYGEGSTARGKLRKVLRESLLGRIELGLFHLESVSGDRENCPELHILTEDIQASERILGLYQIERFLKELREEKVVKDDASQSEVIKLESPPFQRLHSGESPSTILTMSSQRKSRQPIVEVPRLASINRHLRKSRTPLSVLTSISDDTSPSIDLKSPELLDGGNLSVNNGIKAEVAPKSSPLHDEDFSGESDLPALDSDNIVLYVSDDMQEGASAVNHPSEAVGSITRRRQHVRSPNPSHASPSKLLPTTSPESPLFQRDFLSEVIGGGGVATVTSVNSPKPLGKAHGINFMIFPKIDMNAFIPVEPGKSGNMNYGFSKANAKTFNTDLEATLFSGVFKPGSRGAISYRYMGQYMCRTLKWLSVDDWDKRPKYLQESYIKTTLKKHEDHKSRANQGDAKELARRDFASGKLKIPQVDLEFISFDEEFAAALAREWESWQPRRKGSSPKKRARNTETGLPSDDDARQDGTPRRRSSRKGKGKAQPIVISEEERISEGEVFRPDAPESEGEDQPPSKRKRTT